MNFFYIVFIGSILVTSGNCGRLDVFTPIYINDTNTMESPYTIMNNQRLLLELRSHLIDILPIEKKKLTGRFLPPFEPEDLSKWWTQKMKFEIDSLTITKLIFKLIVYKILIKFIIGLFLILITPTYKIWKDYEKSFFSTSTTTNAPTTVNPVITTEVYEVCKKYGWYCPPDYDPEYYYYD